jgi:hypothetical protein
VVSFIGGGNWSTRRKPWAWQTWSHKMAFSAILNNISVIVAVSLIREVSWTPLRKATTCRKSLTNFITYLIFKQVCITYSEGMSWQWSYGSWICNYLCNKCLSSLKNRCVLPHYQTSFSQWMNFLCLYKFLQGPTQGLFPLYIILLLMSLQQNNK